ncbi:MAG: amylo-alpha-1,6-glucosidase [Bdellovibrionia bacterium]
MAKNAAKMPLVSALHGTCGQGNTDPDILTLFKGWARLSTDPLGQLTGRPLQGFFFAGARIVTQYRLRANGKTLSRTFSIQGSANEWCGVFLVPDTLTQGTLSDLEVAEGSVEVSIRRHLNNEWLETIRVRSHSSTPRHVNLELELACPVWDVEFEEEMKVENESRHGVSNFEAGLLPDVRWEDGLPALTFERSFGFRKNAPTEELAALLGNHSPKNGDEIKRGVHITLGLDNPEGCEAHVDLVPGKLSTLKLSTVLAARAWVELSVRFQPTVNGDKAVDQSPGSNRIAPLPRDKSDHPRADTTIRTGNSTLNQIIAQAQVDLELLKLSPDLNHGPAQASTFSAGVPRYIGVFGRDTLTTAWQAALFSPRFLEPALALTGNLRGVQSNPWRDEEPDRILHERRLNPLAALGESNREVYYGDVASTPFWIVTLAAAYNWTGDHGLLERHAKTFEACVRWMRRRIREGNGFIYYAPALPGVPGCNPNQAWKDSDDAIVDAQGRNRVPPHAAAEIQGYCYLAFISAGEIALALGRVREARQYFREASSLKKRFNQAFWMPGKNFFALALDGQGKQIDAIASNAAQCLGSGIIDQDKLESVVHRLFSPEMFSGWGIRTLSSDNPAFDPFSYHRGSVWPVENSTIAGGLAVCGFVRETMDLLGSQFALATLFPSMRLPEVISGHERSEEYPVPGLYPQANLLQSWSVSAISLYLQILFGIRPVAPLKTLLIKPILPDWLPWAEIHDLKVGKASVSLRFWRDRKGRSHWRVLKRKGFLMILEQPPELSLKATKIQRLTDALRSFKLPLLCTGLAVAAAVYKTKPKAA